MRARTLSEAPCGSIHTASTHDFVFTMPEEPGWHRVRLVEDDVTREVTAVLVDGEPVPFRSVPKSRRSSDG